MNELPPLTLVIGGAASGKSDFAEALVTQRSDMPYYLATALAFDEEMSAKIEQHKLARAPDGWTTIEEPRALGNAMSTVPPDAAILIDCATLWLTNLLMDEADMDQAISELLTSLAATPQPVVIVSNEVGQGIVPDNQLARRFRQRQGQLNRKLAMQGELVVQVIAGLPQVLKGSLPEDVE